MFLKLQRPTAVTHFYTWTARTVQSPTDFSRVSFCFTPLFCTGSKTRPNTGVSPPRCILHCCHELKPTFHWFSPIKLSHMRKHAAAWFAETTKWCEPEASPGSKAPQRSQGEAADLPMSTGGSGKRCLTPPQQHLPLQIPS